jgi:hypothetical protein
MEDGKVMVKQLLVSFEPTYGEYKERIRDIEVWEEDVNTHHCPLRTAASDTEAYHIDGSFSMVIELFCDINTSDKDIKIILDKCKKKTFQEKINSKIEYWQKALNMLENKK